MERTGEDFACPICISNDDVDSADRVVTSSSTVQLPLFCAMSLCGVNWMVQCLFSKFPWRIM